MLTSRSIVAISGLGGHAYGSFKRKGGQYMWLSDSLPHDIRTARVMTYGYESGLVASESTQTLCDLGQTFHDILQPLRLSIPPGALKIPRGARVVHQKAQGLT